jgi:hypothetical protein
MGASPIGNPKVSALQRSLADDRSGRVVFVSHWRC